MINSLCLITELTCTRKCRYCYERNKKYGTPLPLKDFLVLVNSALETYSSLTEVLIDYNGLETYESIESILKLVNLPITVTTTVTGFRKIKDLSVKFNISAHNEEDILILSEDILENYPCKINYISVIPQPFLKMHECKEFSKPFYYIVDKFGPLWRDLEPSRIFKLYSDNIKFLGITAEIDNCLLTRVNEQECPAFTQINLYRDGSIRRCPYEATMSENEDVYKTGCKLLKELP